MKKNNCLIFSILLCFCLLGCGKTSSDEQINDTATQLEGNITEAFSNSKKDADEGGIEKVIGDWTGEKEMNTDKNQGIYEAVLSINSDNTWASCVNGDFNWGTWESASEKGNRITLTVQYEGIDGTNEWSFEKHSDGIYYYEYVYLETIEIPMTKMDSEQADQVYNDWYGEVTYIDKYDEKEEIAKTSISLNSDGSWSSDVSGANNKGNIRYISESGHLVILDVVYEGVDSTNQWGIIKKADGKFYYEYYHGQLIEIPIDPL